MTFGNSNGPPASDKQVAYLLALVHKAGYDGFRDARRPLGLTQRQGNGKFTRTEASTLIDQLVAADDGDGDGGAPASGGGGAPWTQPTLEASAAERRLERSRQDVLRGVPAEELAAELSRRGWTATPPP